MRLLAFIALVLLAAGCCPRSAQRYTFEQQGPDLVRFDHVGGDVHVLRAGKWETVSDPAPHKFRAE
jgi:hypothetical protein